MLYRLEVGSLPNREDNIGRMIARRIHAALNLHVGSARLLKIFTVDGLSNAQLELLLKEGIWHDPILQRACLGTLEPFTPLPDWYLEIGFRPGVTDNEARTARDAAAMVLGISRNSFNVYTALQYRFLNAEGTSLQLEDVERIARDLLCNPLIQRFRIKSAREWAIVPGFAPEAAQVLGEASEAVETVAIFDLSESEMLSLSRSRTWALNLEELKTICAHFKKAEVVKRRKDLGLPENPTDLEMECLAQTWSEHCKHKIFAARIDYLDAKTGRHELVDNLYKSCIRDTTAILRSRMGKNDYCKSVFTDNAGVIAFIETADGDGYDLCIKVETHNSPSALDPYGGALTGIVGVNRDPLGTGMGAELVCNSNVFCFASPFYAKPLPPRLLHPRRVLEGVREGVEHGGNKSGIPTVNGSLVFDERYLGKPLVFCGTVGLLPSKVCGRSGWQKKACPGDFIVMVGGRIGKDGIHGATFSSEELHAGSPATAVQIGDPITQRKMADFILKARDLGLYNAITDNGAGGLSSSVGEMAEDSGGCELFLEKAPLKYDGLRPWEILLSEAQERMTLAVAPEKLDEFCTLAQKMDVEASALGKFTASGFFTVYYNGKIVGDLSMAFLHDGVPQLRLEAVWEKPEFPDSRLEIAQNDPGDSSQAQGNLLKKILVRLNVCSKEYIIRQYDHEVRGGSVIKPLIGVLRDGPSDAAVIRPLLESDAGLVLAHGICPKFSDYDCYWMMANAMDEAIRNAVAVGANPDALAGVDNFCWCDPIQSADNPDGKYKLAQLVRACRALRQFSLAYGLPCISGKDSMKNDYIGDGRRISIPPTVLFSVLGVIGNVTRCQSSDFKRPGDLVYLLGGSWRELGGSEVASELGIVCARVPRVDAQSALARYRSVHALMGQKAISACHDCSDGGLAVALAEMCIAGRLGADIQLDDVPCLEPMNSTELLYSESASRLIVAVRPEYEPIFDSLGQWQLCRRIGMVNADGRLRLRLENGCELINEDVQGLAKAFKSTLDW